MTVHVDSEIGLLRRVLIHTPGAEVDHMPPSAMHRWLFDDLLYGPRSRDEHGRFVAILEAYGVEVLDIQTLLAEALEAVPDATAELLDGLVAMGEVGPEVRGQLDGLDGRSLAASLVTGVATSGPDGRVHATAYERPGLTPLPNLFFQRDPQLVLGDGLVISGMHSPIRRREAVLSRFVFAHHPREGDATLLADFSGRWTEAEPTLPSLEGGDVLVLAEGIVLVGVSQRTMERAAEQLVARLREQGRFHTVILVPMPSVRHAMHLDTIFTRLSEGECLVYAPMIVPGGPESLSVIAIDLRRPDDLGRRHRSLLEALATYRVDLEPIYCGGRGDLIHQAREQWTDGANSVAIAPGVIVLYERNERTAAALDRQGYQMVTARHLETTERGVVVLPEGLGEKVAFLLASAELSRARGGPRCMTAPLERQPMGGSGAR